jgi:hypothetical protein
MATTKLLTYAEYKRINEADIQEMHGYIKLIRKVLLRNARMDKKYPAFVKRIKREHAKAEKEKEDGV